MLSTIDDMYRDDGSLNYHYNKQEPSTTTTIIIAVTLVLLSINCVFPVLRFNNDNINHIIDTSLYMCIPYFLFSILYRKMRTITAKFIYLIITIFISVIIIALIVVNFIFGVWGYYDKAETIQMDGYSITTYRSRPMIPITRSIAIRQEREVLPFINIVKNISIQRSASSTKIHRTGPNHIVIHALDYETNKTTQEEIVDLKPWVYW